jgi:heptose I phosphotransferase
VSLKAGTLWQRLRHGVRRLTARAGWPDFAGADWPETVMHAALTDDFHAKQGRSTGRWVLRRDGRHLAVYLKRHYRLPWTDRVRALLDPTGDWSPAMRERRNLEWAQVHGLPVPDVVAAGEFVGPWARLQSFLAVEELTGMLALHEAIPLAARRLDAAAFRRWKAGLTREIARLCRLLHDRRHFHKDLYLCHFFIPRHDTARVPDWQGRVYVIDLHRLGGHRLTWPWWLVKDLAQLLYSSDVAGVDARDRLRFWRAYLGPLRRSWAGWLLKRFVLLKGGRYRAHNAKRGSTQCAVGGRRLHEAECGR